MKQDEIERYLQNIKGLEFVYGGKQWILKSWLFDDDRVRMYNQRGNEYERGFDAVEAFFKTLENPPKDNPITITKFETIKTKSENHIINNRQMSEAKEEKSVIKIGNGIDSVIVAMKDILLEDIEAIKKDAKYIPQAKARNNNVNSLINLAKLQLSLQMR